MTLIQNQAIQILPWCITIDIAAQKFPRLLNYLDERGRIDFNDPKALNLYNQAVANTMADLDIFVPEGHLIPTVCLRQAYLVCLVESVLPKRARILEIGTGASAIIALLAARLYRLDVVATEIERDSLTAAARNIKQNNLADQITLVNSRGYVMRNLVEDYGKFDAVLCYPPTYPDHDASRFMRTQDKGYLGTVSEMIGGGDDGYDFISRYLREAVELSDIIHTISVMLIFEEHVKLSQSFLNNAGYDVNTTKLLAGSRTRYLVIASKSNPL